MKIEIQLVTANAAFEDDFEGEMVSILTEAAEWISCNRYNPEAHKLRDSNGNTVGHLKITGIDYAE